MTDANPLAPLERWLTATLATLEPGRRRQLLMRIGRELRKRNQRRISRQTGPDGTPWKPRKRDRAGKVRKYAKMLQGLREIRRLDLKATPDGMELGYSGRTARIALVHHLGDVSEVGPGGPNVKYPARPLLDWPDDDLAFVREAIMTELESPP